MTEQKECVIQAAELGFQVGKQKLLSGINLEVKRGEQWLIYGMNGCGKTTLLSILAGFRQPTEGSLSVLGQPFTNENILEQRKRIGWISSSFFDVKYRHERVQDIVLSGKFGTYGINWGLTSKDYNRASDLLAAFGLEDKQHMSYDRLSKGQRQNVLIARAFMGKPELLLLDEPCSGLDVLAKARFMELLEHLIAQGMTVLFVTHDINDVRGMFPNTFMLRNGRMFAKGETKTLFQAESLSKFFQQKVEINRIEELEIASADAEKQLKLDLFLS